jgi:hypothetical protein
VLRKVTVKVPFHSVSSAGLLFDNTLHVVGSSSLRLLTKSLNLESAIEFAPNCPGCSTDLHPSSVWTFETEIGNEEESLRNASQRIEKLRRDWGAYSCLVQLSEVRLVGELLKLWAERKAAVH